MPDSLKGRFFSLVGTLTAAATPLVYLGVSALSGARGVRGMLVSLAAGLLALAIGVFALPRTLGAPGLPSIAHRNPSWTS